MGGGAPERTGATTHGKGCAGMAEASGDPTGRGRGPGDDDEARTPSLGELIRRQRELAELPMRRLAEMVGISNPYLSQIERGLREPSDRVLGAIADNLQLSAEILAAHTSHAGDPGANPVLAAVEADPDLTRAQRRALVEMYETYREVTRARRRRPGAGGHADA